jgi:urease alpha subunit
MCRVSEFATRAWQTGYKMKEMTGRSKEGNGQPYTISFETLSKPAIAHGFSDHVVRRMAQEY